MSTSIIQVLVRQAVVIFVVTAGFIWFQGYRPGLSAAFGGCGAVVMSAFLAWRMWRLDQRIAQGQKTVAAYMVFSVAPRFLLVMMWFWMGLVVFELPPVPMVAAFALAYMGYLLTLLTSLKR